MCRCHFVVQHENTNRFCTDSASRCRSFAHSLFPSFAPSLLPSRRPSVSRFSAGRSTGAICVTYNRHRQGFAFRVIKARRISRRECLLPFKWRARIRVDRIAFCIFLFFFFFFYGKQKELQDQVVPSIGYDRRLIKAPSSHAQYS